MPNPRPRTNLLRALSLGALIGLVVYATMSHPGDVAGAVLFSFVGVWP